MLPIQHLPLGSNMKFLNNNEINLNDASGLKKPNEDELQSQSLSTTSNLANFKPLSLMEMSFESQKAENNSSDPPNDQPNDTYDSRASGDLDFNSDRHRNGPGWRNNNSRRYSNNKPDGKYNTTNKSWNNKPRPYYNNNGNSGRPGYERSRYSDRPRDGHDAEADLNNGFDHQRPKE